MKHGQIKIVDVTISLQWTFALPYILTNSCSYFICNTRA